MRFVFLSILVIFCYCQKKITTVRIVPAKATETKAPETMGFDWQEQQKENIELPAIKTLYFGFDSSAVRSIYSYDLKEFSDYCSQNSAKIISLSGHADIRGSNQYNQELGLNRCMAVKSFLQSAGVKNSIDYVSYGEERLAVSGCTDDDCHQKNRRVEIELR